MARTLYRIHFAETSPVLRTSAGFAFAHELREFKGDSKAFLSPKSVFSLCDAGACEWNQVWKFAPGSIAFSEAAWLHCEDMYYIVTMGSERLAASDGKTNFAIINPTSFAPAARHSEEPFDLDHFFAPIFRMPLFPATELFCLSGTSVPGDEFKNVYDEFGFTGLEFEKIWNE